MQFRGHDVLPELIGWIDLAASKAPGARRRKGYSAAFRCPWTDFRYSATARPEFLFAG
jgi:hypothetical protein